MKIASMVVAGMAIVCIGGCAKHLPPHEELTQAVTRSFDANGFNYSSKSRVTHLTVPKQDETAAGDKDMKYVGAVADIIRGFSVNLDGALDMKSKKSEVLYDLRYDRDNVEISVKFPILVDYNTQTIYIGQSLLKHDPGYRYAARNGNEREADPDPYPRPGAGPGRAIAGARGDFRR